jgi:hypothetical protein
VPCRCRHLIDKGQSADVLSPVHYRNGTPSSLPDSGFALRYVVVSWRVVWRRGRLPHSSKVYQPHLIRTRNQNEPAKSLDYLDNYAMFSAWLDITARRYDEKEYSTFNPFGSHQQNLEPKIVLTRMGFNFASPAINSAAAESMSENTKRSRREQFYTDAVGQQLHSRGNVPRNDRRDRS